MEISEQRIVRMCRQGSTEGYELLFSRYHRFIYSVCLHYSGSKDDALDLTQEVFIKMYQNLARFDDTRPLLPWVKRIAVNTCLNYSRGAKGHKDLSINEDVASALADSDTPENWAVLQSTRAELHKAIMELPGQERMALMLRHVQGLSYSDIASAMECPLGTIKTYIFRGRSILREKLRAAGIWEG